MYNNINKQRKKKRKFSSSVEFQPINGGGIVKIEKLPFGKHFSNNCFRQESSVDAKIRR